jgi:hypothetical protein
MQWVALTPHGGKGNWLIVSFGESHLEVLYLTGAIIHSPGPEVPFSKVFSSKAVNFYPPTFCIALPEAGEPQPSNNLTKSDTDGEV